MVEMTVGMMVYLRVELWDLKMVDSMVVMKADSMAALMVGGMADYWDPRMVAMLVES